MRRAVREVWMSAGTVVILLMVLILLWRPRGLYPLGAQ